MSIKIAMIGAVNCKIPFLGSGRFRVFQIGMSANYGSKAAYYLKDRGHKHIAYLSIWHEMPWSQVRLEGIFNVYDQLGTDYSVTPVCTSAQDYYKTHKRLDTLLMKENEIDPFHIGYISNRSVIRRPIEELCVKALEHREITAWIGANDFLALNGIDYLKKRGIEIPGDISIIGFDDCFEAINYHLTTYNFNSHALIHAMYNFLLTSQRARLVQKQSELEICDGYIVERKTVGINRE
jgi:DNA-binding LacI/PurR family transcriptional regulator